MQKKILIFGDGQIGNFYLDYFKGKSIEAQIAKDADIRKLHDLSLIHI